MQESSNFKFPLLFVFVIFVVPFLNYFAIFLLALCVSPTRFARPHSQSPVPNHMYQLSRSSSGAPVGRGMSKMLVEFDPARTAFLPEMWRPGSSDRKFLRLVPQG
jgi:hypothetical protein